MKTGLKIITVSTAAALVMASLPTKSFAGDREWATVGKVLTGVAAVGVVAALAHQDYHADVRYASHCPLPPPPPRCEVPPMRWIPGHYEIRQEKVVVPGYWDTVVVPAEFGTVRHGWRTCSVLIRPEYTKRIWVPERCDVREVRVWVPGHTEVAQFQPRGDDYRRYDAPRNDNAPRSDDLPVPGRFRDQNRGEDAPNRY